MREWGLIASRRSLDVHVWEHALGIVEAEERRLRAEGKWARGRDDFMGVLGIHRAEIRHSRILAWLLDPCGRHGLGASLLRALLAKTKNPEMDSDGGSEELLEQARSLCEVPIEGGRLDIVVEAPGLYLVIENKVDAVESERQCEHYFRTVSRPERRFLLLAPERRALRTQSQEVRDAFGICTYAELAVLLEGALRRGLAEASGRGVALDYLKTLRKEFA